MRIKLLLLITVFLLSNKSFSQNTKTEMAVYNIGINSVFSGIVVIEENSNGNLVNASIP